MRKPQRGYARQDRVKEQIMRELAELVRTGLKDPRAGFITINEVKRIKLFKTPELHFKYDESLERGMSISSLINQVAAEKPVED